MNSKKLISNIRGTRDLYPSDMRKRRWFVETSRKVLENYGYEEYDAPLLESMELYTAKSSPEIVERQAYVFEDRGGEKIVVRPEMTPSLARMVAAKQRELSPILRWYSLPECWRYERPQKGRTRNFMQLNVDLLGSDSIEADVEIIESSLELLQAYGANMDNIEVRVNDRTILKEILVQDKVSAEKELLLLRLLDEKDKLTANEYSTRFDELELSSTTVASIEEFLGSNGRKLEGTRLGLIVDTLVRRGWTQARFDPTLMRGFLYYTSTVFEVYDNTGGLNRALFGGGRYDKLVEDMGGSSMPVVGYAVSDVSIETLLREQGKEMGEKKGTTVAAIPFSQDEARAVEEIAGILRGDGINVAVALPPYDLKKQLKRVALEGNQKAILIMPEELARGEVILRDMQKGEQKVIALKDLPTEI